MLNEVGTDHRSMSTCHVISLVRQGFTTFFLGNLEIQQLLFTYKTIKVRVSTPTTLCVYTGINICPGKTKICSEKLLDKSWKTI